jgi:hypothetical protein
MRQSPSLFARAVNGDNVSPGERALLKLVQGLIVTALAAACTAAAQFLSASSVVDWRKVASVAGVAAATPS